MSCLHVVYKCPKGVQAVIEGMTTRQKFAALWQTEMPYVDMAKALGVTKRCLFRWRVELKLPGRTRGRKRMR